MKKIKEFLEFIKNQLVQNNNCDPRMNDIEYILKTNIIFTNLLIHKRDEINFIYLNNCPNDTSNYNEIKEKHDQGNCIIFLAGERCDIDKFNTQIKTQESRVLTDFILNFNREGLGSGSPIFDATTNSYTQTNLNKLTYANALEKMKKLDTFTIKIGKGLEFDFHNNTIKIDMFVFRNEDRIYRNKLDTILMLLPLMQELPMEEKQHIVSLKPYKEFIEEYRKLERIRIINELNKKLSQEYSTNINNEINAINKSIEASQKEIDNKINQLEKLRNDRFLMIVESKTDMLSKFMQFLERSPIIDKIFFREIDGMYAIELITKKLYVTFYDSDKMQRMLKNLNTDKPNLQKAQIDALIHGKGKVGIGTQKITFSLTPEGLKSSIKNISSEYMNRHISANCLGTFSNAVAHAKRTFDFFALANLYLQYAQTISIGDSAGDSTLSNYCYVIDENGKLIHSNRNEKTEEECLNES